MIYMDNIDCLYAAGVEGYWSCEDCPCEDCKVAVMSETRAMRMFDTITDLIAHKAKHLTEEPGDPIPVEFGPDVELITLEVLADRLAGHRTSYLWA